MKKALNILLAIAVAAFVGKQGYEAYQDYTRGEIALDVDMPNVPAPSTSNKPVAKHPSMFECDGRTQCGQMSSCEEAKFFLAHCPNQQTDADANGVPCEKVLCD